MKKHVSLLLTIVLLLGLCTGFVGSAAEDGAVIKHYATPYEYDNGANSWWVGTNITVELQGEKGFTLTSKDGTMTGANIAWDFTYGQLKETPYFNMTVGNTERASETPYLKIYFLIGSKLVTIKPFENKMVEHWVKAGAVRGENSVNLLEAVDQAVSGLTDDTQIFAFLYTDPTAGSVGMEPLGPLVINEMFLSSEKITPTTQPTTTTTQSTTTTTENAAGNNQTQANNNENNNENTEKDNTTVILIVVAAAVVVVAGIAVAVILTKKKKA